MFCRLTTSINAEKNWCGISKFILTTRKNIIVPGTAWSSCDLSDTADVCVKTPNTVSQTQKQKIIIKNNRELSTRLTRTGFSSIFFCWCEGNRASTSLIDRLTSTKGCRIKQLRKQRKSSDGQRMLLRISTALWALWWVPQNRKYFRVNLLRWVSPASSNF